MISYDEIKQCIKMFIENIPDNEKSKEMAIKLTITTKHPSKNSEYKFRIDTNDKENYGLKTYFCTHKQGCYDSNFPEKVYYDKHDRYDTEFLVLTKGWNDMIFIPFWEIADLHLHAIR